MVMIGEKCARLWMVKAALQENVGDLELLRLGPGTDLSSDSLSPWRAPPHNARTDDFWEHMTRSCRLAEVGRACSPHPAIAPTSQRHHSKHRISIHWISIHRSSML
ncbi:unnamed protein product [Jaminaea pallidilutea]